MAEFAKCRNRDCDHARSRHAHPVSDGDLTQGRLTVAEYMFEKRLKDLDAAMRLVIAAVVELRDAREANLKTKAASAAA